MKATDPAQKEEEVSKWVATVEKEIEPLLSDAAPFFGGSKELTFAEAIVAPFLIRLYTFAEHGELLPTSLPKQLGRLEHFAKWAKAVTENESVLKIYDLPDHLEALVPKMKSRLGIK